MLQHFLHGLGMLHKFRMQGGEVSYTNRYTTEGVVRKAKKIGYLATIMFGLNSNTPLKAAQDPCSALLGAQVCLLLTEKKQSRELTLSYSNQCFYRMVSLVPMS